MRKKSRKSGAQRKRVGKVSYYCHHGSWYLYYRDGSKSVRRRVAEDQATAESIAAQVNAQLSTRAPTLLAFDPVTVADLRDRFIEHHEHVLRSSLATVNRYRSASQHLVNFAARRGAQLEAHQLPADRFVRYLRSIEVAPNGHPNSKKRPLRDKGIRYVLEVARSVYVYASKKRHLPPYTENPFVELELGRFTIEDVKPVSVFDESTEFEFLSQLDDWSFPVHFILAKTGIRPGELAHLLIEDIDFEDGWISIRNRMELGWRIKTGRERRIPIGSESTSVLRRVIANRVAGPVFLRHRFMNSPSPVAGDSSRLAAICRQRCSDNAINSDGPLSRTDEARIMRTVWRDAGAIKADRIRITFMRATDKIGRPDMTCPKSWRHTFATLLQDANVDPVIRQITMGHSPSDASKGGLGMTGVYTHTRPETQKRQIEAALNLWPKSLDLAREWAAES